MPHLSPRAIALRALTAATRRVRQVFLVVNFSHLLDRDFSVFNEHNETFVTPLNFQRRLTDLCNTRFYLPRPFRQYDRYVFERDLKNDDDVPWLSDEEFLRKYRTSQEGLDYLTNLLKDAPVFKAGNWGKKQMPVKYQIMIWL